MNNNIDQLSVKFEKPIYGGEFLGRLPNHKPIFVPFVIPDEVVNIKIINEKKGFARGTIISILENSDKRVVPPCIFFGKCGGCHYQHIGYGDQLKIKQQIVEEQISRLPGIQKTKINPIVPSPKEFNYRNNIQFSVDNSGKLGFQMHNSNLIIPIDDCFLPGDQILDIWKILDLEQFPGLKRVHLREGIQEELMVILESDDFQDLPSLELDVPISVIHLSKVGKIVLAGDDHLIYQVKDQYFHVSAESFFQVNTSQAEKMVNIVTDYFSEKSETLLELYSGVGLFTKFLANKFNQIFAVEESPSACDDFAINLDEYDHINLYVGKVDDIIPNLIINPDAILVDPPRSGLDPTTFEKVLSFQAEKIVYISCDVATLVRDLKKFLESNYQLIEITPIDMFPQTYHIESIAILHKNETN